MKKLLTLAAVCVAAGIALPASAQDIRSYTVNYTNNPPTIDGERGAGEWDDAEPATADFTLLREDAGTASAENLSWQALWDDDYLYIIVETDFEDYQGTEFAEDTKSPDLSETLELFIDPNRDGNPNEVGDNLNSYQFIIPLVPGGPVVRALGEDGPPFFGPLARYNGNFGDNVDGGWWPELVAIGRTVQDGATVVEYQFAFSEFDAVIGDDETSLDASDGPVEGEVWQFNVARITSDDDNLLPVWNWHPGQFFAQGPRGEIVFAMPDEPEPTPTPTPTPTPDPGAPTHVPGFDRYQ